MSLSHDEKANLRAEKKLQQFFKDCPKEKRSELFYLYSKLKNNHDNYMKRLVKNAEHGIITYVEDRQDYYNIIFEMEHLVYRKNIMSRRNPYFQSKI
jgi:uncharacterized protein YqgQ